MKNRRLITDIAELGLGEMKLIDHSVCVVRIGSDALSVQVTM
jgi:hypothetical protein